MKQKHLIVLKTLKDEDWESWKQLPESKVFFGYLRDLKATIRHTYADAFEAGMKIEEEIPFLKTEQGKSLLLLDLMELGIDDIKDFYIEELDKGEMPNE